MLEQSLLKTDLNASVCPGTAVTRVPQIYDKVLPNALPSALTEFLSPSISEIYKVPPTSLLVRAFLKSNSSHRPTYSSWSLWWIGGPSIQ